MTFNPGCRYIPPGQPPHLRERAERMKAKTHCPKGHPYDDENTRVDTRGCRHCRACDREYQHRRRAEGRREESDG